MRPDRAIVGFKAVVLEAIKKEQDEANAAKRSRPKPTPSACRCGTGADAEDRADGATCRRQPEEAEGDAQ